MRERGDKGVLITHHMFFFFFFCSSPSVLTRHCEWRLFPTTLLNRIEFKISIGLGYPL